ncbi:ABC transporter permease [Nocardioides zeae]|uniref:Ribose/xylose/arabinose/galactoside ABC-type transport system permease subunit n=1 Tax=Nocardioides zeae TaxID=1457234 RepID=A0AAJ1U1A1_9ACTN|nr:ABC transporter permease [Nocardioides zeae]MDQ1103608.1 ribose/xylose/arabinose/galactoside ABC-type transport system permease subunit [Nocardioides zeae]
MNDLSLAPTPIAAPAAPAAPPATRSSSARTFVRTMVPLVLAIVVLSAYSNSENPAFMTSANWQNILSQVCVLGILAAGQTFLVIGGQMDLSVGSFVSFVGVLAAQRIADGWSTAAVVALALGIGIVVGLVWGLAVAFLQVPPFVLTLGGLSVFASLALVLSDNRPVPVLEGGLIELGFGEWFGVRAPAVVLVVTVVLLGLLLHFTRFGRNTYALGSAPRAAYLAGVPTRRLIVTLFVLNSTLAAAAGLVMMARLAAGDPRSGAGLELSVVAVTVLGGAALAGGRGTMIGTLLAVLLFGVINASLTFLQVPGAYQSLVTGGILVFAVTVTAAADLRAGRTVGRGGHGTSLASAVTAVLSRRRGS